ncbi:MAG: hypothetical protein GWP19_00610 [Planctomycetia bacterium]|nr:hypothetical protein [Planctomycetia bacterium]
MPKNETEQLGLFEKDGQTYFRVRTGDSWLDNISSPYLERVEKGLFRVAERTVKILSILQEATQAYDIILQKQANYDECLKHFEALVTESGNDNTLQSVDQRYAISEDDMMGYKKHLALRDLQGAAKSRAAADQLLFPCRDYFFYKQ